MRFRPLSFISLVLISFSFCPSALATLEPYLGYSFAGTNTLKIGTETGDLGTVYGLGIGARYTYTLADLFWVGVDSSYYPSLGYAKPVNSTANSNFDAGTSIIRAGFVAGANLPELPFRVWLGYNFIDNMNDNSVAGSSGSIVQYGSSMKAGVGWEAIPLLSINLEYFATYYGAISRAGQRVSVASGNSLSQTMLMLSVSMPLSL